MWLAWKSLFEAVCNKHAPVKKFRVKGTDRPPWLSEEIREMMSLRDQARCTAERTILDAVDFVKQELRMLNTSKATGLDQLNNRLLKAAADAIAPSLTNILNESLAVAKQEFPEDWKQARVTPIHKAGDRALPNNYRPSAAHLLVEKWFVAMNAGDLTGAVKDRVAQHSNSSVLTNRSRSVDSSVESPSTFT
ncbi:hypothetical protein Bbelb_343930 [Branchiostoma belcheri]|nr:hypothetical protein Bbelb_343930 [Branchiostoma belcheri]